MKKLKFLLKGICHPRFLLLLSFFPLTAMSQQEEGPFKGYLYNDEFEVGMRINFYDEDIIIPGQELFGKMAGFLTKDGSSFYWLMVKADVEGNKAKLLMSNDYGSEDLRAELTVGKDSLYELRHLSGSTLKVPNKGKWQNLPKIMLFKRK